MISQLYNLKMEDLYMSKRVLKYKCPFCDNNKKYERQELFIHINDNHEKELPEDFSTLRFVFNYVNNKPISYHGICTICKKETDWDENKGRYNRLCNNPECKKIYISRFEKNMKRTKGYIRLTQTKDGLEKMLANRKISGTYKFKNGKEKTYTGSYEKSTLEFMDKILNIDPDDIASPGPVMEYKYQGKIHLYIPDIYYIPYNLLIEVKDGGDNPNKKDMKDTRARQVAKERHVINNTNYNYLRLTNNNMDQLLNIFMTLKMQLNDNIEERVIQVNENMTPGEIGNGYIPGINSPDNVYIVQFMQNNLFGNDKVPSYGITDSPLLDNLIIRNKNGELSKAPEKFIEKCMDEFTLYKTNITIEEANKKISPYMNKFVSEEFIYETLTDKKLYSFDQIPFTDGFEKEDRFDITLKNIEMNLESYLLGGNKNGF
jgi:hypothetical protein